MRGKQRYIMNKFGNIEVPHGIFAKISIDSLKVLVLDATMFTATVTATELIAMLNRVQQTIQYLSVIFCCRISPKSALRILLTNEKR